MFKWYSQFSVLLNEYKTLLSVGPAVGLAPAEKIPSSVISYLSSVGSCAVKTMLETVLVARPPEEYVPVAVLFTVNPVLLTEAITASVILKAKTFVPVIVTVSPI